MLKITQMNDTHFLFCFVNEEQALEILNGGKRWFNDNFLFWTGGQSMNDVLIHTFPNLLNYRLPLTR